jgi:isoquinoline 1-oxidoreductase alpha subunit
MPYTLNVNGKATTVDVPADMPLLWVLRDVLNLKGTKFGCGIGQCGACTVNIRGRAQRSCQTPVSQAAGAAITTIEGLSTDGSHPLQRASDAEITKAMTGNLCRCGTYLRIKQAVHKAVELAGARPTQTAGAAAE